MARDREQEVGMKKKNLENSRGTRISLVTGEIHIFLQLSFYILHFAPHFCVETGDNESAHAEMELWRHNYRLQMLAQKSSFRVEAKQTPNF